MKIAKQQIKELLILTLAFCALFTWAYFSPGTAFAALFAAFSINSFVKNV